MNPLVPYATALLLGSLHAFETDHMAAVTSFAVRRPGVWRAVQYGVRWAVGHGTAIIFIGLLLVFAGIQLPPAATHWLERAVGIVMIALGAWTVRSARVLHAHVHAHADGTVHAHLHSHAVQRTHEHQHAATVIGMLHGFAGSGSAIALVPVVAFDTPVTAVFYLLVFALGTVAAMATYALVAGAIVGRASGSSVRLARVIVRATGVFTLLVGCLWLAT